jgi:hypothetical protein
MSKAASVSVLAVAAIAMTFLAAVPNASAANEVKMGYLNCHVSSGWGIIFGSSRDLDCIYTPTSGPEEHYKGEINKFGADIGYLASGVILWAVFAPANMSTASALSGHYAGATASATLGLGAGVHVLTGGMHGSIALQPISIEGNNGLNVAAGIATMNLQYVFPPRK